MLSLPAERDAQRPSSPRGYRDPTNICKGRGGVVTDRFRSGRSKADGARRKRVAPVHIRLRPGDLSLVVALMIAAANVGGCSSSGATTVSLAALVADEERYAGDEVRTRGVVRRFSGASGPHFVLEDAEQNRVRLVPVEEVADREGDPVVVVGTFDFDDTTGRVIHVERLTAADASSDRASGTRTRRAASTGVAASTL